MIILNNMYTGRYISQEGNLGHESINLFRADPKNGEEKGKFYIWLNSMGICTHSGVDGCSVIMVRTINKKLYKVIAKAENCQLCPGAKISRARKNVGKWDEKAKKTDIEQRHDAQENLATYHGKKPDDIFCPEKDMFATFWTDTVYEAKGDVYLTTEEALADPKNHIYYADFTISEAMRAYIDKGTALIELQNFLAEDIWEEIKENNYDAIPKTEFNFFKLLRKERDELSFSNALAYFIQQTGISAFLKNCLCLDEAFLSDNYQLLREKNNIDISFFGTKHVVIIENKIDANITADSRQTIASQINKATELYFSEMSDKAQYKQNLEDIIASYTGAASQLSKYYIYAVAYLLTKKVPPEEIHQHIKCFLLIPEYAKKQFKTTNNYFDSAFCLSEKYRLITYQSIFDYFEQIESKDHYLKDFCSAVASLASEFDNELEQEMKRRFLLALQ